MTRLLTTPAIIGILLTGTFVAGSLAGCSSNSAGIGMQQADGQAPGLDAPPGKGGAAGAGSDAAAAGSGGSVSVSGGVTATGGVAQTGGSAGTGGATRTGGATGTGGSTATGGTTGAGGVIQTGGSAGAGGATATGGSTRTGGASGSGGTTQTGGATGAGGSTRTGGTPAAGGTAETGGSSQTGGSTGAGGSTRTGGATGTGGTTGAGGATRTGGATASGGIAGTGGTGGAGKACGGIAGTSCATGEFCEIQAGLCNATDATGTCTVKPQICGDVYQPVCGCDRTTYANDCSRQAAGISKRANGACSTGDAGATTCAQVTTQAECDGRSDCHSVFVDPGTCGCMAAGCCAHFNICANGGRANCSGMPLCEIMTPHCEAPYVVSYTGICYEGCVRQTECAGVDAGLTAL